MSILVSLLEDRRNVKWILIVSLILFFVSLTYSYYPPGGFGRLSPLSWQEMAWYYYSRIVTLLFIATITTGALFTTNFSKKELTYMLTIRLFILSMVLFFLQFLRILFTIP